MDWVELLKVIGIAPTLMLLVVGFFGKNMIEYFFKKTDELRKTELSKKLELHKNQLEQQNKEFQLGLDKSFEEYKNKLEILRLEYQIQFAQLHAKRFEIISELYCLLVDLKTAIFDLTNPRKPANESKDEENERLRRMINTYKAFFEYFSKKKIYVSKTMASKLSEIARFVHDESWNFNYIADRLQSGNIEASTADAFMKKSIDIRRKIEKELPLILEKIEDEFRELLGVKDDGTKIR